MDRIPNIWYGGIPAEFFKIYQSHLEFAHQHQSLWWIALWSPTFEPLLSIDVDPEPLLSSTINRNQCHDQLLLSTMLNTIEAIASSCCQA